MTLAWLHLELFQKGVKQSSNRSKISKFFPKKDLCTQGSMKCVQERICLLNLSFL